MRNTGHTGIAFFGVPACETHGKLKAVDSVHANGKVGDRRRRRARRAGLRGQGGEAIEEEGGEGGDGRGKCFEGKYGDLGDENGERDGSEFVETEPRILQEAADAERVRELDGLERQLGARLRGGKGEQRGRGGIEVRGGWTLGGALRWVRLLGVVGMLGDEGRRQRVKGRGGGCGNIKGRMLRGRSESGSKQRASLHGRVGSPCKNKTKRRERESVSERDGTDEDVGR